MRADDDYAGSQGAGMFLGGEQRHIEAGLGGCLIG